MARLVLLDGDGVLWQGHAPGGEGPDDLAVLPGAAAAIGRLNAADVRVAVVANLAPGRDRPSPPPERVEAALRARLARDGARLDAVLICADPPDRPSPRRKPAPGMLLEALRQFRAEAGSTPMIGDELDDLAAAKAAGCRRVLVRTGKGSAVQAAGVPPDLLPVAVRADLAAVIDAYLKDEL
ncbi:MAG: HAD-IIIA family hydrolase [Alphaproteobacteria bacterium]|nr:HAD-IIIA family hydrolase [Alphaproteobacteria bacterium]